MTKTDHEMEISEALLTLRTRCQNGAPALSIDAIYSRLSSSLESALRDGYALKGVTRDDWGFEKAVLAGIPAGN